jgi:RNA polymerase sigma-70 factor, ECF subfamily
MTSPALMQASPAVESLYQRHVHDVARWAERLAGPGLDVEDIVHEVFTIAYQSIGKFRGDSSLSTWLFGITDRVVRHRRRKERWWRWLSGSAVETAGHLASGDPDPLHLVESSEDSAEVYEVLARLAEPDRQVLILCELEEQGAEEAGRLLGITPNNVRVRLHRARARFTFAYEEFTQTNRRETP